SRRHPWIYFRWQQPAPGRRVARGTVPAIIRPICAGTEMEGAMLKGFRQFLFRGNVIDLAVAVVIGAAFGAVVAALVKDLLTPLIAALVGKPDFSALTFEVNGSKFLYGEFINAVVSFVLIVAAVYFFVVLPVNALTARMHRGEAPPDPTT